MPQKCENWPHSSLMPAPEGDSQSLRCLLKWLWWAIAIYEHTLNVSCVFSVNQCFLFRTPNCFPLQIFSVHTHFFLFPAECRFHYCASLGFCGHIPCLIHSRMRICDNDGVKQHAREVSLTFWPEHPRSLPPWSALQSMVSLQHTQPTTLTDCQTNEAHCHQRCPCNTHTANNTHWLPDKWSTLQSTVSL